MGKRGPAPKPTKLKILSGTDRADRGSENEPEPEVRIPDPPEDLGEDVPWGDAALAEWARLSRELERVGLISAVDRGALSAYCDAWGRWLYWRSKLNQGWIQVTPNGYHAQRPEVTFMNRALDDMNKWGSKFGLSPSDRVGLEAELGQGQLDEARFFGAG